MACALVPVIGGFLAGLHREQGVVFHLRATATGFDGSVLTLEDGTTIAADMLVVGVGVSPRTQLAAAAGLDVDNGILVDAQLQAAVDGSFAAGGLARYRPGGARVREGSGVRGRRQGREA